MATGNRTTSRPCGACVMKVTEAADATHDLHFNAMDKLNQALSDLSGTVRALYAVDTHIDADEDGHETCRIALLRLLMADLGLVEDAERQAWGTVIGPGKGPAAIGGAA
jgi:hypothetical protein